MVLRKLLKTLGVFAVVLLIAGALAAGAVFFMVRGFNPNLFRSELEQFLIQRTGFRVELGEMQVKWGPQLELQVSSLQIYDPKSLEKLLKSDHVQISANLTSLWRKRLWMSQILIRNPEIYLKRNSDGSWNWQTPQGTAASGKPRLTAFAALVPAAYAQSTSGLHASSFGTVENLAGGNGNWEFGFGKVEIRNGAVLYVDQTIQPAFQLEAGGVEVVVRQKTVNPVFHFKATAVIAELAEKNLDAEGDLDLISRSLDFALHYGQDKFSFKGILKVVNTVPRFNGALDIRDLKIETVTPEAYKRGDYVTGLMNAKVQIFFEGANPDSMMRSLRGQGNAEIRNGALKNRNLIKEVFDRLAPVIAVTNVLEGDLPPELNEMLKDRDTPFQSISLSCSVASGDVQAQQFALLHPNYQLNGSGDFRISDQKLDTAMQLTLSHSFSAYLVKKVHELQFICDRSGSVIIPFRYGGILPEATVQPDLPYIASKVFQAGAQQLISRGLEKLSKFLETKNEKNPDNG